MFHSLSKRAQGSQHEALAQKELEKQGYKIICCNFQCKLGEIDIIAQHDNCLIFVEVRYRQSSLFGGAALSVDRKKQKKIIRAASLYLQQNNLTNQIPCRFDVFAIQGSQGSFNWIENAFSAD